MSGDESQEAIHELFQLYSNDIYRYARLTLGNHADAKDVVQEVFVRAIRTWHSFRGHSQARTWLMAIARNYMFDVFRKKKSERVYLEQLHQPYVRDESESIETMMMLEQSLASLKPAYREVFVLRHIHDFSIQETAQILGWSEGKVRTTDYRAIAMIRAMMTSDDQEVAPI